MSRPLCPVVCSPYRPGETLPSRLLPVRCPRTAQAHTCSALAIGRPTLRPGSRCGFRRCSRDKFSVSLRYPSVALAPDLSGRGTGPGNEGLSGPLQHPLIPKCEGRMWRPAHILVIPATPLVTSLIGRVRWGLGRPPPCQLPPDALTVGWFHGYLDSRVRPSPAYHS
jgi:hypothetical protein